MSKKKKVSSAKVKQSSKTKKTAKTVSKAKPAKKVVAKKAAPVKKKVAPKSAKAKAAPKKVAKKVVKPSKPVKKVVAKKAAPKKPVVKKAAVKKVAPKKAVKAPVKKTAKPVKPSKPVKAAKPAKVVKPAKPAPVAKKAIEPKKTTPVKVAAVKPVAKPKVEIEVKTPSSNHKPETKQAEDKTEVLAIMNTIPKAEVEELSPSKIASITSSITNPVKKQGAYAVKTEKEPNGKFEMEFPFRASTEMLYEFFSTPSGLSEWFCDDVNIRNGIYTFIWDGQMQQARLLKTIDNQLARYQWVDKTDGSYFEFRIQRDDLTNDISLIVTDFAETKSEQESSKLLWNSQVEKLMHVIGSIY